MRARLFARFGPDAGLEVEFGGEATIGRGKENTVLLSSREVSQQHARVFFDADSAAYWVEDLGSLNGTSLDGEKVSGRERLRQLHVLTLGASAELFFFELDGDPESVAPAAGEAQIDAEAPTVPPPPESVEADDSTQIDVEMPTLPAGLQPKKDKAAAAGAATRIEEAPAELPSALADQQPATEEAEAEVRFVLEIPGDQGGRFELLEGDNLVGRSTRARIALRHRELSRRHATLRVEGERVWVRDEGSRNHTFVGGEQVSEEVEIEAGAELRFGLLKARLLAAAPGGDDQEAP